MTHREFYDKVAAEAGVSKAAGKRIVEFIGRAILADLLLDGKSHYPGLGIFSMVTRAPRTCINPQTGASVGTKPAYKTIKFKPLTAIKEQINK